MPNVVYVIQGIPGDGYLRVHSDRDDAIAMLEQYLVARYRFKKTVVEKDIGPDVHIYTHGARRGKRLVGSITVCTVLYGQHCP